MAMSISGLGSGFDIDSWVSSMVSVKRSSTVTPLQNKISTLGNQNSSISSLSDKYSALQSALKKFTRTIYNSSSDMWVNTSVTSSDSDYVSASSSGIVSASNVDINVDKIATATVAKSCRALGSASDILDTEFVKLANGQAKEGTFSMFVNNKEYGIEIEENDKLSDVISKINNTGVISAELNEETGVLSIRPTDENAKFVLGSSGDTSNIVSALKLYKQNEGDNGFESAYAISKINTSVAMADENSGLGAIALEGEGNTGTIKINGAEIKIDETTTISELISKINNNSDTHVKASYDSLTNKFILTATQTGTSNISLEEENTDLLRVLGLTEGTGEDEKIAEGSQTLGENAIVRINGNEIVSNSNTITGATSGIANLSITIKKPTTGEDGAPASVNLGIEPDYTNIKSALKTFVDAYNNVVGATKVAVSSDGSLSHDSSLQSILNTVKSVTTTASDNKGEFSLLSQIGITTSSVDPTQLTIDDEKLTEALKNNFESVKYLLSDGYTEEADTGLFDKLLKNVDTILDTDNGYFSTKSKSINSQISLLNTRLDRANTQLTKYQTRITDQFNRMDSIMSQLSSQLTTFQAYLG